VELETGRLEELVVLVSLLKKQHWRLPSSMCTVDVVLMCNVTAYIWDHIEGKPTIKYLVQWQYDVHSQDGLDG